MYVDVGEPTSGCLFPQTAGCPPCQRFRLCPSSWNVVAARTNGTPRKSSQSPIVTSTLPPGKSATPERLDGAWNSGLLTTHDVPPAASNGPGTPPVRHGKSDLGVPRAWAYNR